VDKDEERLRLEALRAWIARHPDAAAEVKPRNTFDPDRGFTLLMGTPDAPPAEWEFDEIPRLPELFSLRLPWPLRRAPNASPPPVPFPLGNLLLLAWPLYKGKIMESLPPAALLDSGIPEALHRKAPLEPFDTGILGLLPHVMRPGRFMDRFLGRMRDLDPHAPMEGAEGFPDPTPAGAVCRALMGLRLDNRAQVLGEVLLEALARWGSAADRSARARPEAWADDLAREFWESVRWTMGRARLRIAHLGDLPRDRELFPGRTAGETEAVWGEWLAGFLRPAGLSVLGESLVASAEDPEIDAGLGSMLARAGYGPGSLREVRARMAATAALKDAPAFPEPEPFL
jgi:hypothetical protein